jgi:hypothetical protein
VVVDDYGYWHSFWTTRELAEEAASAAGPKHGVLEVGVDVPLDGRVAPT